MYPTEEQCRTKLADLKEGDVLTVVVLNNRMSYSTMPYHLEISCSRSAFKNPGTRSGKSNRWFIGASKSRENAERRGQRLLKQLQRLRGQPA